MWEALNRYHLEVQRPAQRRRAASGAESATRFCRSVVDFSQLLQGITDSTMPREEGWYFLQSGKFLERAEWTARTLDVNYRLLVGDDAEHGDRFALAAADRDLEPWVTLLRSLSAYESYHRIESRGIQPSAVIELLILSAVLPRSIRFSIGTGRRRPCPHRRAGPRLQRLRADAGLGHRERGTPGGGPAARGVRLSAARRPARARPAHLPARHPTPLLSHRRPRRGRVLRPPASDRAGNDGVRYRIRHRTSYRYASEVFESFNEVRLQPLACATQTLLDFDLQIEPPATTISFRDYYGNAVHDFGVAYLHDSLVIEATSDVVTHAGADEPLAGPAEGEPDASPFAPGARGKRGAGGRTRRVPRPERVHPARRRLGGARRGAARRGSGDERTRLPHARSRPCARTPRVPDRHHDREQLRRRGARRRERRLPGLRARADLAVPPRRAPCSLRQRVPRQRQRGDGLARLDRGVHPALWVARYRRDARHALHGAARQGRRGPRLRRRRGVARQLSGRRPGRARSAGELRGARRRRSCGAAARQRRRARCSTGSDPEPRRDAAVPARDGDDAGDGRDDGNARGRGAAAAAGAGAARGRAADPAAAAAAAAARPERDA